MQVQAHIKWKALLLLVLISALQLSMVLRGLHHHESVCLLDSGAETGREILHAHTGEHEPCAWSGLHFSACTFSFPEAFAFAAEAENLDWVCQNSSKPFSFSAYPSGRGPPVQSA